MLEQGQSQAARVRLRTLLWDDANDVPPEQRAEWRRMVIRSYLQEDALDDARSALIRYQQDFGAGTSAKSSKIIHGGIRYLQQLRLDKLRESAIERAYWHRAAPHLTRYLPFIVPTFDHGIKGKASMRVAMAIYRALCVGEDKIDQPRLPLPLILLHLSDNESQPLILKCNSQTTDGQLYMY